ncbi:MAG: hypothetical protein ACOCYG_02895 [Spirochaetota bacterium]
MYINRRLKSSSPRARRVAGTMESPFGAIALAGHAATARDEMRHPAAGLLELADEQTGASLRELLSSI